MSCIHHVLGCYSVEQARVESALDFLLLASANSVVRTRLKEAGFTAAELERGYALVHNVGCARLEGRRNDNRVANAEASIEAWTDGTLRRCDVALGHDYPKQHAFLLEGLEPAEGLAAVPLCKTLLRRFEALEERAKATKSPEDGGALLQVSRRCCTAAERKEMAGLIEVIEAAVRAPPRGSSALLPEGVALERWVAHWRRAARAAPTGAVSLAHSA